MRQEELQRDMRRKTLHRLWIILGIAAVLVVVAYLAFGTR
jgi:hypothetical protein